MLEDSGLRAIPDMTLFDYLECERLLTCAAVGASEGQPAVVEQLILPLRDHRRWHRSNLELTLPFIYSLHSVNHFWYLD